ncbi:MAG: hypothetical protein KDK33_18350 [Leptospiraceae bacterium]|nr:hypothetical protein [Leptospiraceae bacterium]
MEPSGLSGLPQLFEAFFMGTFWFPIYVLLIFLFLSLYGLIQWRFVIVPAILGVLPLLSFAGAFILESGLLYFSQLLCILPALLTPILWVGFRNRRIWSHFRILLSLSAGQIVALLLGYFSLVLQDLTEVPYTIIFLSVSVAGTTRHIFLFPFLLAALTSYLLLRRMRKEEDPDFT